MINFIEERQIALLVRVGVPQIGFLDMSFLFFLAFSAPHFLKTMLEVKALGLLHFC